MDRKEKEGLIKVVKLLEKSKYDMIQKVNKLVFNLEKIITEDQ